MPAILTLDYDYKHVKQPWFTKKFTSYQDLYKWLREDSIIVLPQSMLDDESLKKKLILTKLALPKVSLIVIAKEQDKEHQPFFTFVEEKSLDEIITQAMINQHKIIDNRKILTEIIKLYT